jgi:PadR family transcriptional regulator PadR
MASLRMSLPTQLVLEVLLEPPIREWYGLELCRRTGFPTGSMYPIMTRLLRAGWIRDRWEEREPGAEGEARPRRRYYKLTELGAQSAKEALAASDRSGRLVSLRTQMETP